MAFFFLTAEEKRVEVEGRGKKEKLEKKTTEGTEDTEGIEKSLLKVRTGDRFVLKESSFSYRII